MEYTVDLGRVTAYADAVAGGFEGTREEFEEFMAHFAESASRSIEAQYAAEQSADEAEDYYNRMRTVATQATTMATNAMTTAGQANTTSQTALGKTQDLEQAIESLQHSLSDKVDQASVVEGYLHLYAEGQEIEGSPFGPFSSTGGGGGGGGGTGNNAVLTMTNANDPRWNTKTISTGDTCPISIQWASLEDDMPTGNGTLSIRVNNVLKATLDVAQGIVTQDVSSYLSSGTNTISFSVSDIYGNQRAIRFSVQVVELSLTSDFVVSRVYEGVIPFTYTPTGAVSKTVHFALDGVELEPVTDLALSGIPMTYNIAPQRHGVHNLKCWFTCVINNSAISSEVLNYDIMCVEEGVSTPIVAIQYNPVPITQFDTILIPYNVYRDGFDTCQIQLMENGVVLPDGELEVNREQQYWTYRADNYGEITLSIKCVDVVRSITMRVAKSDIDVSASTNRLALFLSSYGRSNNEANPATWKFTPEGGTEIASVFSNFGFAATDGWVRDEDGITALRVTGNDRIQIPYHIFGRDFKNDGKTIEFEFAARDVRDYDSVIISCISSGIGLEITAQEAKFHSEQVSVDMQYKDDEHVRLSFVVDKRTANGGKPLIYLYVNAVMCACTQYSPTNDNFSQLSGGVDITIGSNDAAVDLYCVRVYDRDLTRKEILDNWIADTQNGSMMLDRYNHNNVTDDYGNVVTSKLPKDLPYMIIRSIDGEDLPQAKKDKHIVSGSFTYPDDETRSFTFENCEIDVQGTSSAGYPRKNYKMKFNGGFDYTNYNATLTEKTTVDGATTIINTKSPIVSITSVTAGGSNLTYEQTSENEITLSEAPADGTQVIVTYKSSHVAKYPLTPGAVPVKTFTMKADFASSEGANNVELVRLYNDVCPYRTPPQVQNPTVRQGIDGFPMVIFWDNGRGVTFLGKYNFNNDKGTEDVYGFKDGDESWEMLMNPNTLDQFRSDDFYTIVTVTDDSGVTKNVPKWQTAFEGRFPDGNTDTTRLHAFASWVVSTDIRQATDINLPQPVTYDTGERDLISGTPIYVTFTQDTGEYRLAKFKYELEQYGQKDALLFYYLFTELFLMVDSRAKNAFPSVYGVNGKWFSLPYDMDTALGINNEGKLVFPYNLEDIDIVNGSTGEILLSNYSIQQLKEWEQQDEDNDPTNSTKPGAYVFNGQESTLWINMRLAFATDLQVMYKSLRGSNSLLSYGNVCQVFEDHQKKWSEAIFNEDSYFKYLKPYIDSNSDYLEMLQGSKQQQRNWWLYNRFQYIDSKYNAGDAYSQSIDFRAYATGNVTVRPYADIYAAVGFSRSVVVSQRAHRDTNVTLECPSNVGLSALNDLECYIYSARQLSSIGDLSHMKVGTIDLSKGVKLESIKLGDGAAGYTNPNLTSISLAENKLLRVIDLRNCINLTQISGTSTCAGLEEAYLEGTRIRSIDLPDGGNLQVLHFPNTITNITIKNQPNMRELTVTNNDYSNLSTLQLVNVGSGIDTLALIRQVPNNIRLRYVGFNWTLASVSAVQTTLAIFENMSGVDANGNNTDHAQLIGHIHISDSVTGAQIRELQTNYPNIEYTADSITSYIHYYTYDGSLLLHDERIINGGDGRYQTAPVRNADEEYEYVFSGWSRSPNGAPESDAQLHVVADRDLYAAYILTKRRYTVYFFDNETLLQTVTNVPYGSIASYPGQEPEKTGHTFYGWLPELGPINGNMRYYAQFTYDGNITRGIVTRGIDETVRLNNIIKIADYGLAASEIERLTMSEVTEVAEGGLMDNLRLIEFNAAKLRIIGASAFRRDSSMTEYTHELVTTVGETAFSGCINMVSANLRNATTLGNFIFNYCTNLERVDLASALTIPRGCFQMCQKLTYVNLRSAKTISRETFKYCNSLESIELPACTRIEECAFADCTKLKSITIGTNTSTVVASLAGQAYTYYNYSEANPAGSSYGYYYYVFQGTKIHGDKTGYIYVADSLVDRYKSAANWSYYASQIKGISEKEAD